MAKYQVTNFGNGRTIPSPWGDIHLNKGHTFEVDDEALIEHLRHFPRIVIQRVRSPRLQRLKEARRIGAKA